MGSALFTGISGLNASSKELDVIANNLPVGRILTIIALRLRTPRRFKNL